MNPAQPQGPPIEQVISMRQQGLSNNQITQALQREGFKTHEIFDAMNQADMKAGMSPMPLGPQQEPEGLPQGPPLQTPTQGPLQESPLQGPPQGPPGQMPPPMGSPNMSADDSGMSPVDERIEEIAEAIIDEKWSDLLDNIKKIIDWKELTEARLDKTEQKFNDLKNEFDKLHSAILDRIGQYDQNMSDVGSEIKALEKVFQKILPTLTENVNELSRISSDFKHKI